MCNHRLNFQSRDPIALGPPLFLAAFNSIRRCLHLILARFETSQQQTYLNVCDIFPFPLGVGKPLYLVSFIGF